MKWKLYFMYGNTNACRPHQCEDQRGEGTVLHDDFENLPKEWPHIETKVIK